MARPTTYEAIPPRQQEDSNDAFQDSAPTPGASVDRVAVRLPPFWSEDPDCWFAQAEAQFQLSGIKEDSTKFNLVVTQLDNRYAREVKELIKKPPANDKYEKLKQQLTKRVSVSRELQISQLMAGEELGDRKPSQFLRHLQTLADGGVSEEFLRGMWANRLPTHVQAIIISQSGTLEEVAELADKICEISPPSTLQVASTSGLQGAGSGCAPPVPINNFDALLQRLDTMITARIESALSQQIAQLSIQDGRHRAPFRHVAARPRNRSRSRSRSRVAGICWYHNIFGDKAQKCTKPCNFRSGNKHDSQ